MKIKGFTLTELLVVIAIIGILASVVVVNYNSSRQKARDAKRKTDLMTIQSALELYYADKKSYPSGGTKSDFIDVKTLSGISDYLQQIPIDPKDSVQYQYKYVDGTGQVEGCQAPFYVLKAIAEKDIINDTCYTNSSIKDGIFVVGGR